jgi:hypothetical protein
VTVVADETAPRAATQPSDDWWRPTRPLATWLSVVFALQAVVLVIAPLARDQAHRYVQWHRALDAALDGRTEEAQRISRSVNDGFDLWSLVGLMTTLAVVLVIIWMWRSTHNARALGRTGARLSPGWAIASWLIPFANLVLPYLIYSDLWRSADPGSARGDGWRALPVPGFLRAFWALYVAGTALALGTAGLAVGGAIGESSTRTLLFVGGALEAAAALLNIVVVREITARQEAVQARDPAPLERPWVRSHAGPTVVDGPGWYPDPGRGFDHRYWDGTAWTEHVSRAGVSGTAPITPADWYPDPTGRFHWRYWTGREWTEHVSRDERLYLDPIDGGSAPDGPARP